MPVGLSEVERFHAHATSPIRQIFSIFAPYSEVQTRQITLTVPF
jgi:hypothetical protein